MRRPRRRPKAAKGLSETSSGASGTGSTCGSGILIPAFSAALRARSTAALRSVWLQRPKRTGSRGRMLGVFQWVRSRTAAIVFLVVPTSLTICESFNSG